MMTINEEKAMFYAKKLYEFCMENQDRCKDCIFNESHEFPGVHRCKLANGSPNYNKEMKRFLNV